MFGLNEAQYNIVKRRAKSCDKEIRDIVRAGSKYDAVAASIIDRHHSEIAPLISRIKFVWLIGYINGRWVASGQHQYE